ncbi:MAG: MAPEG family protein [Pseudomonadota bacterium]
MQHLTLTDELYWLTLTLLLTACLWIPYIVQLIVQLGPVKAVWDPTGAHPHNAEWALRAKRAHYNAVENLVIFAPLTILVVFIGAGDELTNAAAAVFFFARAAHYIIHLCAIPVIRTLVFLIGFGCQIVMAGRVLGWV